MSPQRQRRQVVGAINAGRALFSGMSSSTDAASAR